MGPRKGTYKGNNGFYEYDGSVLFEDEQCRKRDGFTEKLPKRNTDGVTLIFPDQEEFRPIKSSVTNLKYNKMWDELPQNWIEGWFMWYCRFYWDGEAEAMIDKLEGGKTAPVPKGD